MKRQINSRKDGVTKDMVAGESSRPRTWHFPNVGDIEADSYANALAKAKKIIKSKK